MKRVFMFFVALPCLLGVMTVATLAEDGAEVVVEPVVDPLIERGKPAGFVGDDLLISVGQPDEDVVEVLADQAAVVVIEETQEESEVIQEESEMIEEQENVTQRRGRLLADEQAAEAMKQRKRAQAAVRRIRPVEARAPRFDEVRRPVAIRTGLPIPGQIREVPVEVREVVPSSKEALSIQFDADINARRAKLAAIKQRIARMDAELQARVANKKEIIELRFQVLQKEAKGLGWSQKRKPTELEAAFETMAR